MPSRERPISPIRGDEPWTRDDDAYWDVVDVHQTTETETESEDGLLRSEKAELSPAAFRRPSDVFPQSHNEFDTWLSHLSPSYGPPTTLSTPRTPSGTSKGLRAFEKQRWEEMFKQHAELPATSKRSRRSKSVTKPETVPNLMSQIEQMPVAELKWQLYSVINERLNDDQSCKVCWEPLDEGNLDAIRLHYHTHHEEADVHCPFCGMEWGGLDSQWKASHIFAHNVDESSRHYSSASHSTVPLYSLPTLNRKASRGTQSTRRNSKVTFSPKIVERRIAYNDQTDTGMDGDVSSIATMSPRKSSLRSGTRRANLKVDTSAKPKSKVGKRRTTTGRKGTGTGTGHKRKADGTYHSPSASSSHIDSPEFHLMHRYPADDPRAAWDPRRNPSSSDNVEVPKYRGVRRYRPNHDLAPWDPRRHSTSASDHIPSPYLPHVTRYPPHHPDARFDPRKFSKSSYENLEYYTGRRGPRSKAGKAQAGFSSTSRSSRRTTAPERIGIGETPGVSQALAPGPESDTHHSSTVSNASSASVERREKALQSAALDIVEVPLGMPRKGSVFEPAVKRRPSTPASSRKPSAASQTVFSAKSEASAPKPDPRRRSSATLAAPRNASKSSQAFKKRTSSAFVPEKRHRPSDTPAATSFYHPKKCHVARARTRNNALTGRASSIANGHDFIPFDTSSTPLLSDHSTDVLTGNPFGPVPLKKTKATKASRVKKASPKLKAGRAKTATLTPKQAALAAKKAAAVVELTERRARRSASASGLRTISGRAYVEPLPLAPARRLSKLATAGLDTPDSDLFDPATPPSEFLEASHAHARGRRSSAPTPSPSMASSNRRRSGSATAPGTPASKSKAEAVLRKASYGTAASDVRPMVPLNTLAVAAVRVKSRFRVENEESGEDSEGVGCWSWMAGCWRRGWGW
ncbi:hypothetical protein BDV95DRAFT_558631 [Massariosphaeria phaeospora]|uniref:Uncharacterized protein n=1 Tax=Massariosphaeria phaeospora TaxID=100035 RepID=A0A7C8IE94_9PLEO|nr:hypothetical protein BDV95DRAFT_558631 [Massariosphaeria phaeospora]